MKEERKEGEETREGGRWAEKERKNVGKEKHWREEGIAEGTQRERRKGEGKRRDEDGRGKGGRGGRRGEQMAAGRAKNE